MGQNRRGVILFLLLTSPALAQVADRENVPTAQSAETLVTFDWRQAELRRAETGWQLRAGNVLLKEFQHEPDGREALRIVQELRLTQRGAIGTPQPVLEY